MLNVIGIILGALAILISVSLHEAGHMGTAKAFGMKVTRYFVGFGPTLFSFRKGETEYGVKGIPLGGFVKITGMTPQDEDAEDKRAMWRYPVWKRTIVMAAGSMVHFLLGFLIFWGVAATASMPNPENLGPGAVVNGEKAYLDQPAFISLSECVYLGEKPPAECTEKNGPAFVAGLKDGDQITTIGGTGVTSYGDLVTVIRSLPPNQAVAVDFLRAGENKQVQVTPLSAKRAPIDDPKGQVKDVAVFGIGLGYNPALPKSVEYNAIEALPVGTKLVGQTFERVFSAIGKFPEKIPGLWTAITGGERDADSPVSVVGASRISGELFEVGDYPSFFLVVASLNLFVGLFNLLPLLPLDGGHIAISWFEKVRSWIYARLRKPDPGRVDYFKLMPLTYTVILIFGAFTLLTVTADIVNPISIYK